MIFNKGDFIKHRTCTKDLGIIIDMDYEISVSDYCYQVLWIHEESREYFNGNVTTSWHYTDWLMLYEGRSK